MIGALGAGDVVDDLQVRPNPFTPNGDGINDVAEVGFSLFKVYEARSLKLRIFRLDGTRVRTMAMRALGEDRTLPGTEGTTPVLWCLRDSI